VPAAFVKYIIPNAFAWEQEYRFWFDDDELVEKIEVGVEIREEELSSGRLVGVSDMQRLIKKIVVAPCTPGEFLEQVRSALDEDYHPLAPIAG
jgi:hypothetical protein